MTRVEGAEDIALRLLQYCESEKWAGFDPYDGLNSSLFAHLPGSSTRWLRIGWTQLVKRCPINVRPLLGIPRTVNPKGLALFLSALVKLSRVGLDRTDLIESVTQRLEAARSVEEPYWCWGYSFPWQTRSVLVPRGAPNAVCTTFAAHALLDVYDKTRDARCLEIGRSSAEYIVNELYWTDAGEVASLAYPTPSSRTRIHNANFLGAALLSRVFALSGEVRFREAALRIARYSAGRQATDGSWVYGELPTQQWIDNVHTGFNLCALRRIGQYAQTAEFDAQIRRGAEFYRARFFGDDGAAKYFHDRTYPVDVHSVAQSILTLVEFRDMDESNVELARSVLRWARTRLWNVRGYFNYQVRPWWTTRIPYMRWGQAWMLLAMSALLEVDAAATVRAKKRRVDASDHVGAFAAVSRKEQSGWVGGGGDLAVVRPAARGRR